MKDSALPKITCPRIPAPSGPVRSGIFSTPAARMTGADSRNENRAASCRQPAEHAADHDDAVPADAGQQRQDLHRAEADGVQEADADQSPVSLHREARLLLLERPLA